MAHNYTEYVRIDEEGFEGHVRPFLDAIWLSRPGIITPIRNLLKVKRALSADILRSYIEIIAAANPKLKNSFSFDYTGAATANVARITWTCSQNSKKNPGRNPMLISLVCQNGLWQICIEGRTRAAIQPYVQAAKGPHKKS